MNDLWQELKQKSDQLQASVKSLRKSGTEYAQAERDYKILLRQECLKLKDDGLAIGLIDKTCYGIPSVAEARFKRDVAEAVYKANSEAINSLKLQLRLLDSQISREWGQAGKE
nr:MAG TPA: hypothetical protein [Ackermannviridae sp.]